MVNLQFVLSIGTLDVNNTLDIDLGGLQNIDPTADGAGGTFGDTIGFHRWSQKLAPIMQQILIPVLIS